MKIFYKCDICDRTHDTMYDVGKCESSHTFITPKWYWYVPFVSWFIMIYLLFTQIVEGIKNSKMGEEIPPLPTLTSIKRWQYNWIFMNPIIIAMMYCVIVILIFLHR